MQQIFLKSFAWTFLSGIIMAIGFFFVPLPYSLVFVVLFLGVLIFTIKRMYGKLASGDLLRQKAIPGGITATALIMQVTQGNTVLKMGVRQYYEIMVHVEVTGADGSKWPAIMKITVAITDLAQFRVGEQIAIVYNPQNTAEVILASPSEAAALISSVSAEQMSRLQTLEQLRKSLEASFSKVSGQAIILSVTRVAMGVIRGGDLVHLEVQVRSDSKPGALPFTAGLDALVATASFVKCTPGNQIFVLFDSTNPQRICLTGLDHADSGKEIQVPLSVA